MMAGRLTTPGRACRGYRIPGPLRRRWRTWRGGCSGRQGNLFPENPTRVDLAGGMGHEPKPADPTAPGHSMNSVIHAPSLDMGHGLCYRRASPVGSLYHFTAGFVDGSAGASPIHRFRSRARPPAEAGRFFLSVLHGLFKESKLTSASTGPWGYPLGLFSYPGWVGFSLHSYRPLSSKGKSGRLLSGVSGFESRRGRHPGAEGLGKQTALCALF